MEWTGTVDQRNIGSKRARNVHGQCFWLAEMMSFTKTKMPEWNFEEGEEPMKLFRIQAGSSGNGERVLGIICI